MTTKPVSEAAHGFGHTLPSLSHARRSSVHPWLFALPLSLSLLLPSFASGADLWSANNAFGFTIAKQLAKEKPDQNLFVSPYSISTALQMARAGAAGETRDEMDKVLNVTGMSRDALARAFKELDSSIKAGAGKAELNIANAIWFDPRITLKPEFTSLNDKFYGAKLSPLNFVDPGAAGIVNGWVSDATHGKIPKLVEGSMSDLKDGAFLCNAIYFKGRWAEPFMKNQTQDKPFHLVSGQQKNAPLMHQKREFQYFETDAYQAVALAYAGSSFSMYVFLPRTNSNPQKVADKLRADGWSQIESHFAERKGTLEMPRFKMEYGAELKEPLMALGMRRAFRSTPPSADFSGITASAPLFISKVTHKSFVEANEEGTEAAAATGVGIAASAAPIKTPPPFEMIVDRPFLFVIADGTSHTILFLGMVFDPKP